MSIAIEPGGVPAIPGTAADVPRSIDPGLPKAGRVFRRAATVVGASVLVLTGSIGLFLGYQSIPTFRNYGLGFLTESQWVPSLDVVGIHGVGGIVGALGTAIVAAPGLGGYPLGDAAAYSIGGQFMIQLTAVGIAVVWSGVVALVAMLIVKAIFGGARVSESSESDGLDLSTHGERAYN